jgi:hypothetical protein
VNVLVQKTTVHTADDLDSGDDRLDEFRAGRACRSPAKRGVTVAMLA